MTKSEALEFLVRMKAKLEIELKATAGKQQLLTLLFESMPDDPVRELMRRTADELQRTLEFCAVEEIRIYDKAITEMRSYIDI